MLAACSVGTHQSTNQNLKSEAKINDSLPCVLQVPYGPVEVLADVGAGFPGLFAAFDLCVQFSDVALNLLARHSRERVHVLSASLNPGLEQSVRSVHVIHARPPP